MTDCTNLFTTFSYTHTYIYYILCPIYIVGIYIHISIHINTYTKHILLLIALFAKRDKLASSFIWDGCRDYSAMLTLYSSVRFWNFLFPHIKGYGTSIYDNNTMSTQTSTSRNNGDSNDNSSRSSISNNSTSSDDSSSSSSSSSHRRSTGRKNINVGINKSIIKQRRKVANY